MAYVIGKSTQYFWMPSLAWWGHCSASPPLGVDIDYDAAAGPALEDLTRELRQVAEPDHARHGIELFHRQIPHDPRPGGLAPRLRAHHRIDAEQFDATQQERDYRDREIVAACEPAGGNAGIVLELSQHCRERGAAHGVDGARPALGVERTCRRLCEAC